MFLYPWGDMHSLNLGWFLLQFKDWVEKIQDYLDNGGGTSENLANVIAPVFNAANSYSPGDYVLYNDELYKALEPVPAGTWNPDAWTRCLVTEEMGSSASGVDNVARLMIAGQYSNTYNYQKYAICRYNDKLWMCNTNLPAGGEEWEPSHWDEITVGAGLTGLRRSVETLSQDITALNNALNPITRFIRNKKIAIFGDSISDETMDTTHPAIANVWVKEFRNIVAPYNCTITNYSKWGYGFVRQASNSNILQQVQNANLTDIDTVIIFGGVNDFQNNIPLGYYMASSNNGTIWQALKLIGDIIKEKEVFVITPLQTAQRGSNNNAVTLEMYRVALKNWCDAYNFHLINGSAIDGFVEGSPYYNDGLHPKNAYTYLIARYIFNKMLCAGEAFKPHMEVIQLPISVTNFSGAITVWCIGDAVYNRIGGTLSGAVDPTLTDLKTIPFNQYYMQTAGMTDASTFGFVLIPGSYTAFGGQIRFAAPAHSGYTDFQVNGISAALGKINPVQITP